MIDDNEGEQEFEQQTDEQPAGENGTDEAEVLELTEEAEAEPEEEPKPKNPVQVRIDKLTEEKYEERREKEAKAREADYWRGVAEGRIKPQEAEPTPDANEGRPDPNDYEFGTASEEYTEALVQWRADQIVSAKFAEHQQQQQAQQALHSLEQGYAERVAKVKDEIPDYDEVVTQTAKAGKWPCPPLIALAAKESPVGPKVLHHLATNKAEAIALANLSTIEQAMEFGRLSAQFAGQSAPQPRIATNAPEPAPARTKGGQFAPSGVLSDGLSTDDWMKRRGAQKT